MPYREGSACARCESTATTADGRCLACGHVWGDAHACVHCHVVAPVVADRVLGLKCVSCGMPRIAAGWTMPPEIAEGLLRAVRTHRRAKRMARSAIVGAVLCMPLGLLAAGVSGFTGWIAVLLLWGVCIAVASIARRSGQRQLATSIARAAKAHRAVIEPRVRIDADATVKPTSSERDRDEVADEPLERQRL